MDKDQLKEVIPHYLAMLAIVFGVLALLPLVVEGLSFWIELLIVAVIVFGYQAVTVQLGVAPSRWERE